MKCKYLSILVLVVAVLFAGTTQAAELPDDGQNIVKVVDFNGPDFQKDVSVETGESFDFTVNQFRPDINSLNLQNFTANIDSQIIVISAGESPDVSRFANHKPYMPRSNLQDYLQPV